MRRKFLLTPPPGNETNDDTPWDGTTERRSGEDRRKHRRPHPGHIDWRSGFDRRKTYPVTGKIRDHRGILISLLLLFNFLSIADGFYTALGLATKSITEANPVFRYLLAGDPLYAAFLKIVIIFLLSLIIWLMRKRRIFIQMLLVLLGIYGLVFCYHIYIINWLL